MEMQVDNSDRPAEIVTASRGGSFVSMVFCGLIGALIGFWPHLASRIWFGTWEFYQDFDEVLYRLISIPPLDGSWRMRDVFIQSDRDLPTTYSWTQFVPTSRLAATLGFDAISLGQFWRLTGGFLQGVALYVVFAALRIPVSKPRSFMLLGALLAISDAGFVGGRVLLDNLVISSFYVRGIPSKPHATAFGAYRVITPLLNLPISLMAAALLSPLVLKRNPFWAVPAAILTALTVCLYFFQWTALFAGGSICLTLFLIWDHWKKTEFRQASLIALMALFAGMLLGSPQIIANFTTFADPELKPILERVGRGQIIPRDDPGLYQNLLNRWFFLKLGLALIICAKLKHRGLWLFTCIGATGYVLANSALITRTEFENWHWLYVYNPFLAIVVYTGFLLLLMKRFGNRATVGVICLYVLSSLVLRSIEVNLATESRTVRSIVEGVREFRPIVAQSEDDGRNCVAGDLSSHILALSTPGGRILFNSPFTSQISLMGLDEVHERYVLNRWLAGVTREELADTPDDQVFRVQPQQNTYPEWKPAAVRAAQLAVFDRLETGEWESLIAEYQPDWLVLEKRDTPFTPTRGGTWEKVAESETHLLWKRRS